MKYDKSESIGGSEATGTLGRCAKSNELVIAPSYKEGAFDSHAVDCPFVFRHGDEYRMTFVGWDRTGYRTGWASSSDLCHWVKMGLLVDRGPKGSPTEYNVALTSILRDNDMFGTGRLQLVNGRYVGTYHTYPSPGYEEGPGAIGLCYSTDLMEWQLDEPVLLAKDGKEWERGGLYKSWIMKHDATYYLFYNAKNRTEGRWFEQTGVAYSSDLRNWTRHPANPVLVNGPEGAFDERFASDPCILNASGRWFAFYFGLCSDGHARDGVATSNDLITWTQSHRPILDVGPDGSVDSRHAHKPAVIWSGERLFHFYCAVAAASNGTQMGQITHSEYRGISYATWTGPDGVNR
jgi:predicted GH43/DUF377 family glycosyl hydrolase